ncbi:MAG: hypothetical protein JW709_01260 [Sedimentisphaerales bacterium]|nr:hypothetical protein [Sedimentisphaerales bacterium]
MDTKIRSAKRIAEHTTPIWNLGYLDIAESEARKFLTDDQYAYVVQLFDELAYELNPLESKTQDVRKIDEFYELRDKGGILGKINVRIYFAIIEKAKLILALSAYKKEDEGPPPQHIIIRSRHRLRYAKEKLTK